MDYIGVSYQSKRREFIPRVKYQGKLIHLKTWHYAEVAARIRDVAAKWLYGPDAKLNFPEKVFAPAPVTESDIAGWLLENGVPLKILVHRVPLAILVSAGVKPIELIQAGVSTATVMALTT